MGPLPSMKGMFIMLAAICGFIGWGVIELILWAFSHLTWTWG